MAGFFCVGFSRFRRLDLFTGIVQDLVSVQSVEYDDGLLRLTLDLGKNASGLQLGASVAVNGTCLTVTRIDHEMVMFDVIAESLRITNLDSLEVGALVNVERSFQVGDEVGGHIVSGHVTTTGTIVQRVVVGHDHVLRISVAEEWLKFIFHKGFIALDGASLTVSALDRDACWFEISLIPETLGRTTLGHVVPGDKVNIEVDSQTVTTVETVERLFADPKWRNQLVR